MALSLASSNPAIDNTMENEAIEKRFIRYSEDPAALKEQRVLKAAEAATILQLDYQYTIRLMKNGFLPCFRLGKEYRTSYLSCLAFLDDCLAHGTDIKTLL